MTSQRSPIFPDRAGRRTRLRNRIPLAISQFVRFERRNPCNALHAYRRSESRSQHSMQLDIGITNLEGWIFNGKYARSVVTRSAVASSVCSNTRRQYRTSLRQRFGIYSGHAKSPVFSFLRRHLRTPDWCSGRRDLSDVHENRSDELRGGS
jgi:hypothetical protein